MVYPKLRSRFWRAFAGVSLGGLVIALLMFFIVERIANRPSPVHSVLTPAEIHGEDEALSRSGLVVPGGSLLLEHPFSPPWTAHSLLVPSNWFRAPVVKTMFGSRRVRADRLLADLDVLEPVMERAYGGRDTAAARGWNWDGWFANWRRELKADGHAEIPWNQAFAPVDALLAFQRDNHTQIPLMRHSTVDGSQSAVLESDTASLCTRIRADDQIHPIAAIDAAQDVRSAKLWATSMISLTPVSYIAMPGSYGTPEAVLCGGNWIPLLPIRNRGMGRARVLLRGIQAQFRPNLPRLQRLGNGVVYVRLPTFDEANYRNLHREEWPRREPGDRVLIVDLRDNGGGSAGYGLAALKDWIPETRMTRFQDFGTTLDASCLYLPLKWNAEVDMNPSLSPDVRRDLQHLLNRMAQPYPPGCPRAVLTAPARWTYPEHHFAPQPGDLRIVALVNSGCASDCELFAMQLASLRETIVAGDNTFGVGQFIQPGYSVLPNTGLPFRIALGYSNFYGDNRSYDGYGLDVDIVLPDVNTLQARELSEFAQIVAKL